MRVPQRPRYSLIEKLAKQELQRHGQKAPPVEVERMVARVATITLFDHDTCDGWTTFQGGRYTVYLNRALAASGRGRWTLAHELGHIVLGHFCDFPLDNLRQGEESVLDREADVFARELLMPAEWVTDYVQPPCDAKALRRYKEMFGVSWEALILRLDELRIQSKDTRAGYLALRRNGPGASQPA